jgi:hypothetical protein
LLLELWDYTYGQGNPGPGDKLKFALLAQKNYYPARVELESIVRHLNRLLRARRQSQDK